MNLRCRIFGHKWSHRLGKHIYLDRDRCLRCGARVKIEKFLGSKRVHIIREEDVC